MGRMYDCPERVILSAMSSALSIAAHTCHTPRHHAQFLEVGRNFVTRKGRQGNYWAHRGCVPACSLMRCVLALVAIVAASAHVRGHPAARASAEDNGKPAECGMCKLVMEQVMTDATVSCTLETSSSKLHGTSFCTCTARCQRTLMVPQSGCFACLEHVLKTRCADGRRKRKTRTGC